MTDTYTPSQAVAWIATRDAEWAALSDTERGARALYASHGGAPETKRGGAAGELLAALRAGRIVATDAVGDVLPKTKWTAVDAEHLQRAANVPTRLPWLLGVRLDADKVRNTWPAEPQPTRQTKHVALELRIAWFRQRLQRAEQAGERIAAKDIRAECRAELRCSEEAAREAWNAIPTGGAKQAPRRPKRETVRPETMRES
ncbi:MAG: hypothetical protein K2X49_14570 [Acetobacteraceae bacterium]|nr:hypothetical protein [Acetobacteraceae bacterium]